MVEIPEAASISNLERQTQERIADGINVIECLEMGSSCFANCQSPSQIPPACWEGLWSWVEEEGILCSFCMGWLGTQPKTK